MIFYLHKMWCQHGETYILQDCVISKHVKFDFPLGNKKIIIPIYDCLIQTQLIR